MRKKRMRTSMPTIQRIIKSKGIELVSDDSLKLELTTVYDVVHRRFQIYNSIAENASRELTRPYYLKNFNNLTFITRKESATPNNFHLVINDSYYVNIVERKLFILSRQIRYYFTAQERMKKLKRRIDKHFGES